MNFNEISMQRTSNKLLQPLQFRKSAALMANVAPFFTEARNLICSWPMADKEWGNFFFVFYFFLVGRKDLQPGPGSEYFILRLTYSWNTEGDGRFGLVLSG